MMQRSTSHTSSLGFQRREGRKQEWVISREPTGTNGLWQCAEWGIQEEIKGETKVLRLGDRMAMPLELHTEDSQDADG